MYNVCTVHFNINFSLAPSIVTLGLGGELEELEEHAKNVLQTNHCVMYLNGATSGLQLLKLPDYGCKAQEE